MNIEFEKELVDVKKIDDNKRYWFVRTFGGAAYYDYVDKNYIGLGFNNVPYEYIKNAATGDYEAFKTLTNFINNNTAYKLGEATKWARQLISFENEIKIGDTVVIPSLNSHTLSLGTVESDVYLTKETGTFKTRRGIEVFPEKRRRIKWDKEIPKDDFQGDLKNLISSQQGVTNADKFFDTIEGVLSNIFIKEERIYLIININQDEEINAFELSRFLSCLTYFYNEFCIENGIVLNEELSIKIKLQSKGKLALKALAYAGLFGLSTLLVLSNNTEVKLEVAGQKLEGKSDGFLKSLGDFLDKSQERKIRYEIFKDSMEALKVKHINNSIPLLNDNLPDSSVASGEK